MDQNSSAQDGLSEDLDASQRLMNPLSKRVDYSQHMFKIVEDLDCSSRHQASEVLQRFQGVGLGSCTIHQILAVLDVVTSTVGTFSPTHSGLCKAKLQVFWPETGSWLPAELLSVFPDGTFCIQWSEDGSISDMPSKFVRHAGCTELPIPTGRPSAGLSELESRAASPSRLERKNWPESSGPKTASAAQIQEARPAGNRTHELPALTAKPSGPKTTSAAQTKHVLPGGRPTQVKHYLPGYGEYVPAENSVLIVSAGAPWIWDRSVQGIPERSSAPSARYCGDVLHESGYAVTNIWDRAYDKNPQGFLKSWDAKGLACFTLGLKGLDLKTNGGKNNATVAEDLVLPTIRDLVSQGRGPAVILTGSRGGLHTLPRLWELGWRGPAVCVNAGCVYTGCVPKFCRLTLVTGGMDYFDCSADRTLLPRRLKRKDAKQPVLVYHDPHLGHTGAPDDFKDAGHHSLSQAVLERLISLTVLGASSSDDSGDWPAGAVLYEL